MDEFVLILRHDDGTKITPPQQLEIWLEQTQEWIKGIQLQDKFVSGAGLPFDDAVVVWPEHMITNGPFGDRKQTIGGMITVKAENYDEAVDLAKSCPVLQGEGHSVEVRKMASFTPPAAS